MKKLLLPLLVCLALLAFPSALSETLGDFSVTGGPAVFDTETGVLTLTGDASVTLADGVSETAQRIVVAQDASVTLDGVAISAANGPAVLINPGVSASIILAEGSENTLSSQGSFAAVEPAYEKGNLSSLTVSGEGKLTAAGGANSAAIGGSKSNTGVHGAITIASGTLNLTAGGNAAALGTSENPRAGASDGSYKYIEDRWGDITINGGSVTASASGTGAGIGGGNHSDSGHIVINGGTVTANGYSGIGSGLGSSKPDNENKKGPGYYFADVTINGGTVTASANSGANGAGIGGGMYADAQVTITGGTVVATGNYQSNNYHHGGAGIGGGYLGHAEVSITGGDVTAVGGGAAAGIGSGGAPNSEEARGSSRRSGETTCEYTSVAISGGTVTATGGEKGGAGIGGGVGADRADIDISGGEVTARGAKSDDVEMRGGAGIGSGFNAFVIEANYMTDTLTNVTVTGGSVIAVGGWGAAGIGSGAANKMAETITMDFSRAAVQAYADGTKFAIDTRQVNADGTTTSVTEGRTVTGSVLQGTFVHAGVIGDYDQNPEGLSSIVITGDGSGESRELTLMPAQYRSFATDVSAPGQYTVYTDDPDIGQGEGRYFAVCSRDVYAEEYVTEKNVLYRAGENELSDNFYLYPVKTVVVEKEVLPFEGTDLTGLDAAFHFALQEKDTGDYVVDEDGNMLVETIEVAGGIPQNKGYFINVEDKTYDLWEIDESGEKMSVGYSIGDYMLVSIATVHGTEGDNNATISPTQWTDQITVQNTFLRGVKIIVRKTWQDNHNARRTRPDKAVITLSGKKGGEDYTVTVTLTPADASSADADVWEQAVIVPADFTDITLQEEVPEGYSAMID